MKRIFGPRVVLVGLVAAALFLPGTAVPHEAGRSAAQSDGAAARTDSKLVLKVLKAGVVYENSEDCPVKEVEVNMSELTTLVDLLVSLGTLDSSDKAKIVGDLDVDEGGGDDRLADRSVAGRRWQFAVIRVEPGGIRRILARKKVNEQDNNATAELEVDVSKLLGGPAGSFVAVSPTGVRGDLLAGQTLDMDIEVSAP